MLKERLAKVKENAVRKYQVVVYDKDSLGERRNFSIKPVSLFTLTFGIAFLLIVGTTALIFSVPSINQYIPGFQDPARLQEQYQELEEQNLMLAQEVEKLDTMLAAFTRIAGMNNPTAADQEMWAAVTPAAEPGAPPAAAQEQASEQPPSNQEVLPPTILPLPAESAAQGLTVAEPEIADYFNLMVPLDGIISNPYNPQKSEPHYGMDIVADENSMIKSIAAGVVIFSEYSNTTGHVLGIWHRRENMVSFYKHNSKVFKQVGEYVFAGEAIAVIGNTGINSSGTHLHFELWYDNNPVDPTKLIDFN